jgi:hypothetical protein
MAEEAARRTLTRALAAIALALTVSVAGAAGPSKKHHSWAELTVDQQEVLAPLKPEWEQFSVERRGKWIAIAKRYPGMKPEEQQRVQRRMEKWAALTPEQRRAARERYKSMGKLSAEKRQALRQQWAEYQALPPIEKRKLDAPAAAGTGERRKLRAGAKPQQSVQKPSPVTK